MAHLWIRRAFQAFAVVLLGASPAGAQSFGSIFTTLPADFGHLFTPSSAIVLGVGGAGGAAIHPKDDDIATHVAAAAGTTRARVFRPGGPLGDTPAQVGLALAVFIAGRASGWPRLTQAGVDLVDAQIVNGVLTQALKVSVNRTRPDGAHHSFPSGHTSATFATAVVVQQHYGWKIAMPLYGLGTYVAASRMVGRHHFASDVMFGAAIGIASGRAAAFGSGRNGVTVSPSIVPGGFVITGAVGSRQ